MQAKQSGSPGDLLLETQGSRVAGEDDTIRLPFFQLLGQCAQDGLCMAKAKAPAQQAQIEPGDQALVEPVVGTPAAASADVNVADVGEPNALHVPFHQAFRSLS